MAHMKLLGGVLIALGILVIWMIVIEYALAFMRATAEFKWIYLLEPAGYLGFGVVMLVLGILVRGRTPKNWFF